MLNKTEIETKLAKLSSEKERKHKLEGNKETLLKEMEKTYKVTTGKDFQAKIKKVSEEKNTLEEEFKKECEEYEALEESVGL